MLSRPLTGDWLAQRHFAAALSIALVALVGCHNITTSLDGPLLSARRDAPVDDPDQIDQWPGWRGGLAHGVSPALSLPTKWSQREQVRFKTEIPGRGHSSPIVWGDAIFLTSVVGEAHRAQLTLLKLDRASGRIAWQRGVGQPIGTPHLKYGHASATAATDGERVFAYFGAKGLFCFDFDGNRLWHQPLSEQSHEWGTSSSPVIAGGLVLQLCDSQEASLLTAFDKRTGAVIWRQTRDSHACWTSPVAVQAGDARDGQWQVVINGTGGHDGSSGFVSAYDLWSGAPQWQLAGTADIVCPTAIVGEGLIIAASGVSGPMQAIEIGKSTSSQPPEIRWQHRTCGPCVPTGVIYRERLYAVTSDGIVSCLALDDGRTLWREQLASPMSASLVAGAGHIYAATEAGDVYVFKADDTPQIAATNSLHELCLATPAIAENEIFIRTESRLYCISEKSAGDAEDDAEIAADIIIIISPSDMPVEQASGLFEPFMELVQFTASDGVELHGWLQLPTSNQRELAVDAVIFLHGAGSNFYSSSLLRGVAPHLLAAGVAVFAINTRGHDLVTTLKTPQGGKRGGAAFELVDDCRHDVHGAVDWLVARGFRNVALVGHSLGAIKAVYAQAFAPHAAVKFVAAIGPPRLSFTAFSAGPRRDEFLEIIAQAEAHVAAGQAGALMEVTLPLPLLISAAGYLDKYGLGERYDVLKFAAQVPCPALYTFGSQELASSNAAFHGLDAAIRNLAPTAASPIDVEIVSSADHFYSGCTPRLAQLLLAWPRWRTVD